MEQWKLEPAHDLNLPPRERMRSLRRESGLVSTLAHLAWWALIRMLLRIWHRLKVTGREHLPTDVPFVMIANHCSHLDAMVLASPIGWRLRDRVFPIAAGDVFFETPMMSTFAAMFINALPMWRHNCGRHALMELRSRLIDEPCGYILFPEGARSRDGEMLPFKAGLGMLIVGTSVPIIPCYIRGAFEAMPANARVPRPTKITLTIGRPIRLDDVANNRQGWQQACDRLRGAIEDLRDS